VGRIYTSESQSLTKLAINSLWLINSAMKKSFKPMAEWGPVNPKGKKEWDILVGKHK